MVKPDTATIAMPSAISNAIEVRVRIPPQVRPFRFVASPAEDLSPGTPPDSLSLSIVLIAGY